MRVKTGRATTTDGSGRTAGRWTSTSAATESPGSRARAKATRTATASRPGHAIPRTAVARPFSRGSPSRRGGPAVNSRAGPICGRAGRPV
ncbi:hypothetical protein KPB2_5527 [Klebsiella pneumoniae Kb677]|nr:hypothetical protein KPB2_5527 [Klebsiella pneumoniae Kb677]